MRLVAHGKRLGETQELEASAVVACLDDGQPVAVLADIEGKIALRTAKDKSFEHTLQLLGFNLRTPKLQEILVPGDDQD